MLLTEAQNKFLHTCRNTGRDGGTPTESNHKTMTPCRQHLTPHSITLMDRKGSPSRSLLTISFIFSTFFLLTFFFSLTESLENKKIDTEKFEKFCKLNLQEYSIVTNLVP